MSIQQSRRRLLALFVGLTAVGIAGSALSAKSPAAAKKKKGVKRKECPESYLYSSKKKKCVQILPDVSPDVPGCFLTSACCEEIGLPDNCFELETLRHFRDHYMAGTSSGKNDIATYYRLAPELLRRIPPDERSVVFQFLYARYIFPSVVWIKLRQHRRAAKIYTKGMRNLIENYAPELLIIEAQSLCKL